MAHHTVPTNGTFDPVDSAFRQLAEERDDMHALACAIADRLSRRDEAGEIVDFVGSRLGLMLEEMLGDINTLNGARDAVSRTLSGLKQ